MCESWGCRCCVCGSSRGGAVVGVGWCWWRSVCGLGCSDGAVVDVSSCWWC